MTFGDATKHEHDRSSRGISGEFDRGSFCPTGTATPKATTEFKRMRLYRKRRREGMRYVRIPLHVTKIDELVRLGFLRGEQCQDPEALQMAVLGIIYGVLARAARAA